MFEIGQRWSDRFTTRFTEAVSRWFIIRDLEEIGVARPMFHCSVGNDLASVEFGPRIRKPGLSRHGSLFSMDLSALTHPDDDLGMVTDVDVRIVILNRTPLSDTGVQHIAKMPGVGMLYAADTKLSDASVDTIASIPSLAFVFLTGTDVTMEGIERLRTLRPDVRIEHETIGVHINSDEP